MAYCTLEDRRVIRGALRLPRTGRWHADLVVDSPAPLAGSVKLAFGDGALTFRGSVYRGEVFQDAFHCRIVAGANGLANEVPAKYYRGVPLSLALGDVLAEVGEQLAASSDPATLSQLLPKWSRQRGPAAHALVGLADLADASWRFLPSGALWVGRESWPELDFPHQLLRKDPADDRVEIASDLPLLRPGVTFGGRKVSAVVHTFGPDRIRTEAWLERESSLDRFKGALASLIRTVMREVDYHKPYAARVVLQEENGTLHLRPDSDRIPGLTGVPIRYGLPGVTARVPPGARCVLEFEGGDPRAPIVTAFEPGALVELSFDGGSRRVARVGDRGDGGALSWSMDPSGKTLTLGYRKPGGATSTPFLTLGFPTSVVATPPAGALPLETVLTTGADRIRA